MSIFDKFLRIRELGIFSIIIIVVIINKHEQSLLEVTTYCCPILKFSHVIANHVCVKIDLSMNLGLLVLANTDLSLVNEICLARHIVPLS